MIDPAGVHHYAVVDAFSDKPLYGNPVTVVFDADDLPSAVMQRIAREMNMSETTFVLRPREGGDARIRIFTPVNELPFAGHAMLGTSALLATRGFGTRLRLETGVGVLAFEIDDLRERSARSVMRQPMPSWQPFDRTGELLDALGVPDPVLPVEIYDCGPRHVLLGLDDDTLSKLDPDHRALARFDDMAINCFAGAGTSWRNRMFSPAYGVVEDAATGSAAGALAVHLSRHADAPRGEWLDIAQGVEIGRHSRMRSRWASDEFVEVGGHALTVAEGTLHV